MVWLLEVGIDGFWLTGMGLGVAGSVWHAAMVSKSNTKIIIAEKQRFFMERLQLPVSAEALAAHR